MRAMKLFTHDQRACCHDSAQTTLTGNARTESSCESCVEGVDCGYQAMGERASAQIATAEPNMTRELISAAVSMMVRSRLKLYCS
jgi:hypothetical protein